MFNLVGVTGGTPAILLDFLGSLLKLILLCGVAPALTTAAGAPFIPAIAILIAAGIVSCAILKSVAIWATFLWSPPRRLLTMAIPLGSTLA